MPGKEVNNIVGFLHEQVLGLPGKAKAPPQMPLRTGLKSSKRSKPHADLTSACTPAQIVDARPVPVMGNPKMHLISTSHIERQNLTKRIQLRRFTRLTNAFSKKLENLKAACALYFAWYNFCRIHSALRVTPAMAAGVSDHVWDLEEIAGPKVQNGKIAA
jgi:hypothetical protein